MAKLFISNSCGFPLDVNLWLGLTSEQPIYLSLPFQRVMLSEGKIGQFLSIFWLRKIKFRLKHGKCPIFEDINQMNGWLAPDLIGQFVTRNCSARPPVCLESLSQWLTTPNTSSDSSSQPRRSRILCKKTCLIRSPHTLAVKIIWIMDKICNCNRVLEVIICDLQPLWRSIFLGGLT